LVAHQTSACIAYGGSQRRSQVPPLNKICYSTRFLFRKQTSVCVLLGKIPLHSPTYRAAERYHLHLLRCAMSQGALISWRMNEAVHGNMDLLLTASLSETAEERQVRMIQFMALNQRRNDAAHNFLKSHSGTAKSEISRQNRQRSLRSVAQTTQRLRVRS
jgi:hypothetical protein